MRNLLLKTIYSILIVLAAIVLLQCKPVQSVNITSSSAVFSGSFCYQHKTGETRLKGLEDIAPNTTIEICVLTDSVIVKEKGRTIKSLSLR